MPVAFLAHGSPMNAIESNYFTDDWLQLMQNTARPSAIVIFSAHWHVSGTRIQSQSLQQTIHDFAGFPSALQQCQYPAKGAPALAEKLQQTLINNGFEAQLDDSWGLDHGSWSLLTHLYPEADIPCIQISLDTDHDNLAYHFALAQSLKSYRQQGVLFLGSGNIVHNIRKWMTSRPTDSNAWAVYFDNEIYKAIVRRDWQAIFNYQSLAYANEAVPTIEHFLPLVYILALSDESDTLACSDFGFNDLSTACSRSIRFSAG
jgi:4,5-DOPA dioxygenase extradiol